jgi:hypothetical protein
VDDLDRLSKDTWRDSSDWLILANLLRSHTELAAKAKRDLDLLRQELELNIEKERSAATASSATANHSCNNQTETTKLLVKLSTMLGPKEPDPMDAVLLKFQLAKEDLHGDILSRSDNISSLVSTILRVSSEPS